jgi:hypothetical protein
MEFNISGDEIRVYEVAEDGSLVAVDHLPGEVHYGSNAI